MERRRVRRGVLGGADSESSCSWRPDGQPCRRGRRASSRARIASGAQRATRTSTRDRARASRSSGSPRRERYSRSSTSGASGWQSGSRRRCASGASSSAGTETRTWAGCTSRPSRTPTDDAPRAGERNGAAAPSPTDGARMDTWGQLHVVWRRHGRTCSPGRGEHASWLPSVLPYFAPLEIGA